MRNRTKLAVFVLPLASLIAGGCGRGDYKPPQDRVPMDAEGRRIFGEHALTLLQEVPSLDTQPETIRPDLAKLFCTHVYKLPHKADFTAELAFLCDPDGSPSELMGSLDRFGQIVGDVPQSVELEHRDEGDLTYASYAAVYSLPIPPKWVRSGAIAEYMMRPSRFDYVVLDGAVTDDLGNEVGGDLQFSKYRLSYRTDVSTPDGKPFVNDRVTEFNAYQVHGGNPDIGIGTEHLVEPSNPDYPYFNTITVTIGDVHGGSVLITIIRGAVRHNGYPDLARRVFSDTANAQATNVHDGLLAELASFIIETGG